MGVERLVVHKGRQITSVAAEVAKRNHRVPTYLMLNGEVRFLDHRRFVTGIEEDDRRRER